MKSIVVSPHLAICWCMKTYQSGSYFLKCKSWCLLSAVIKGGEGCIRALARVSDNKVQNWERCCSSKEMSYVPGCRWIYLKTKWRRIQLLAQRYADDIVVCSFWPLTHKTPWCKELNLSVNASKTKNDSFHKSFQFSEHSCMLSWSVLNKLEIYLMIKNLNIYGH